MAQKYLPQNVCSSGLASHEDPPYGESEELKAKNRND